MKQTLILLILITTIIFAVNYIRKIHLHTKALKQCCLLIENIEILLSYNNLSVNEIFRILSENKSYYLLSFINEVSKSISNNTYILYEENVKRIFDNKYLNKNEKESLIDFLSMLGKSDLNGQIINCKTYKEIFKKKLNDYEINEQKNCKTSGTLIVGIGFLIIIMIV